MKYISTSFFNKYNISTSTPSAKLMVLFQTDPSKRKDLPLVISILKSPDKLFEEELFSINETKNPRIELLTNLKKEDISDSWVDDSINSFKLLYKKLDKEKFYHSTGLSEEKISTILESFKDCLFEEFVKRVSSELTNFSSNTITTFFNEVSLINEKYLGTLEDILSEKIELSFSKAENKDVLKSNIEFVCGLPKSFITRPNVYRSYLYFVKKGILENDDNEIKNLYFDYVGKKASFGALEDINLTIKEGEFVCILGASGCGKSTLLSILNGLNKAKSGQILIDGKEIKGPGVDRGTVFQNYSLFPWQTVRQNVLFGAKQSAKRKQYSRAERNKKVDEYIGAVGLLNSKDKYPFELSGGMQQRVAIARALALESDILLLDEPFSAIDPKLRLELQELVSELSKKHNKTVVFITHDIDEAILLADRIVVMEPKHIKAILDVNIAYPRSRDDLVGREDYEGLHRQLISLFYEDVKYNIDSEVVL